MTRFSIPCFLILLLVFSGVAAAQPPRPEDLTGEDRFVPFYEWWLDERPDESEVVLEAYRAALGLAVEDAKAAAVALQDLEARLEVANTCVTEVQNRLLQRLAEHDPKALVPLLGLQRQVFLEHVRRSRIWLADDTRHKLERWVDLYVDTADDPQARVRATRALVAFANLQRRVQVEGMLEQSLEVLEHASRIAPDDSLVLHLTAMHGELLERDDVTLEMLERLRALQPDDPVVRLRLARARGRTGQTGVALAELTALGEADVPQWVQRLAIQDRVRLLEEAGRHQEARLALADGVEHFPDDVRLSVALAADRRLAGEAPPGASAELLKTFVHDPGVSPRLIYEAGPFEEVERVKAELEEDGWEFQPELESALDHDFQKLWSKDSPRRHRRQARYSRCRLTSNPQLPELLR